MDVAGESSTDKSATQPIAQPVVDIDAAGAIPEDNFTQYVPRPFCTVQYYS